MGFSDLDEELEAADGALAYGPKEIYRNTPQPDAKDLNRTIVAVTAVTIGFAARGAGGA